MNRWVVVAALCGLGLTVWVSQEAVAQDGSFYVAEVIRKDAPVRSGQNDQAYHCVLLSPPANVTVVSTKGDWLKILPPPGCYSVIGKSHVRTDANAQRGTVIADNVWARAGGFPEKRGEFHMLQQAMSAGDLVRILGEIGDYYKIVPPRGSYFWIAARDVRKIGESAPAETSPATPATATTRPTSTQPSIAPSEVAPDPADAEVTALKALDALLASEYKKPWDERDFGALLARYKAMKVTENSGVGPYLAERIDLIETEIQRRSDMQEAARIAEQGQEQHEAFRAMRARLALATPTGPATRFLARGIVTESLVYPGTQAIPKRYVLRDPQSLKASAYLKAQGDEDLASLTGKLVGLYGDEDFDRGAGVVLIAVKKAVVLEEAPTLPKPAAPVLNPLPEPTPEPAAKDPATEKPAEGDED
jgi:hypothetical protein